MICKVSLTTSGERSEVETAATLTIDGGDEAKFSDEQIRRLQDVCLAAVSQQNRLAPQPENGKGQSPTASATLHQLARLYRAADRLPAFELPHLQHLSRRLYQKPVEKLSMLEMASMTSTLNAVMRGMVDLKEVLKTPTSTANGHVADRLG
ncbi:MAG: hypothetical protein ACREMY_09035 [bacterium]